jgi:AAA domain, putative AbiEii toxin, Type IV TA system
LPAAGTSDLGGSVRLDSVVVRNYRGLRLAEAHGLADEPVVTIAGVNGSGKTLLLEAIVAAWRRGGLVPPQDVGPFGDDMSIRLEFVLEPHEVQALENVVKPTAKRGELVPGLRPGTCPSLIPVAFTIRGDQPSGQQQIEQAEPWARALIRSLEPIGDMSFRTVDHLPANRLLATNEGALPDPGMVGPHVTPFSQSGSEPYFSLQGLLPWLTTLDYMELTAPREGRQPPADFELIADRFEQATGKRLERPKTDMTAGLRLLVRLPSGERHDLSSLSDGEQQVLALMYFAHRTSATGGILLIDEPELHLHPSLQQALIEVLRLMSDRAQVWIATHAAKLIAASPLGGLVHLDPPYAITGNQAARFADEAARLRLHQELGLSASDLLNNDLLVVIEGPTDWERLSRFFPTELNRAARYIAGGRDGVLRAVEVLEGSPQALPWVAVVDRDLADEQQVVELMQAHPNLVVWSRRMLENVLLEPELLAAVMANGGRPYTAEQMEEELRRLATERREEVLRVLITRALNTEIRPHSRQMPSNPVDRVRAQLERDQEVAQQKQQRLNEIAARQERTLAAMWDAEWPHLVHGKSVLSGLAKSALSPYRDLEALVDAVAAYCQRRPAELPTDLQLLRTMLQVSLRGPQLSA